MKILVPLKRVADPDNANKIKVNAGKVETTGLEWKPNPFDEYAVETALRLTENGTNTKARQGEVVVVTFGAAATAMEAGSVSVKLMPDCAGLPAPLVNVKVSVEVPPTSIVVGAKALLSEACTTVSVWLVTPLVSTPPTVTLPEPLV